MRSLCSWMHPAFSNAQYELLPFAVFDIAVPAMRILLLTIASTDCDINTYRVLNKTIIVLNSREAIEALFEKQVDRYSDKPGRRMANISDLIKTLPFMDADDFFYSIRKQFHLGIGPSAVHQYDGDYEAASLQFVQALAQDPECTKLDATIDDSLGHIFLKVSTGYHGEQTESVLQQMNNLAHFAADVLGDKYQIFDILPICACALGCA